MLGNINLINAVLTNKGSTPQGFAFINTPTGKNNQAGFTVVELLITLSLISVIAIGVLGVFTNYLVMITRNNALVDMTVDSQNLLRSSVEELRYGTGVRQVNNITDPNGPFGGWNTNNSSFVIIIAVPATNAQGKYIINTATGNPYNNELVYFKQAAILYKRVLANPSAVGNKAVTTCPASSVTSTCPEDRLMIENIDTMTFSLYDQDNVATTNTLIARSVKIDLSLARAVYGETLRFDNSIRVTLRNNFR